MRCHASCMRCAPSSSTIPPPRHHTPPLTLCRASRPCPGASRLQELRGARAGGPRRASLGQIPLMAHVTARDAAMAHAARGVAMPAEAALRRLGRDHRGRLHRALGRPCHSLVVDVGSDGERLGKEGGAALLRATVEAAGAEHLLGPAGGVGRPRCWDWAGQRGGRRGRASRR